MFLQLMVLAREDCSGPVGRTSARPQGADGDGRAVGPEFIFVFCTGSGLSVYMECHFAAAHLFPIKIVSCQKKKRN